MKYYALNGFRHPLNRYFNNQVECINVFNWTRRNAIDLAYRLDDKREPFTLIGFSDGASAAVAIARHSRTVVDVYAHSPMYWPDDRRIKAKSISLFRTKGDQTPTFESSKLVFNNLFQHSGYIVSLDTLNPLPALPIRNVATLAMKWKVHQFHNCLHFLPKKIINKNFL